MYTKFLFAKNQSEMFKLADKVSSKGYKINRQEGNFILLRKTAYGNIFLHIVLLIVAFLFLAPVIFINLIYFLYNFYVNSIMIFITTEEIDKEGNTLEFSKLEDIVGFNEDFSENRNIFEDFKNTIKKSR